MGHMQQIGYAITMYADDFGGHLPPATGLQELRESSLAQRSQPTANPLPDYQADTMQARSMMAGSSPSIDQFRRYAEPEREPSERWEGIGNLVPNYLDHPEVCYCPSHRGNHDYSTYRAAWRGRSGTINTNYQYRIPGKSPYRLDLDPRTIILTDGMETKSDFNHIKGSNTLRIDSSVGWFHDVEGKVYMSLPDDVSMGGGDGDGSEDDPGREPAWREFDSQGSRSPGSR